MCVLPLMAEKEEKMLMCEEKRKALRALVNELGHGEWRISTLEAASPIVFGPTRPSRESEVVCIVEGGSREEIVAKRNFIAASKKAMPELLDTVDAVISKATALLDSIHRTKLPMMTFALFEDEFRNLESTLRELANEVNHARTG